MGAPLALNGREMDPADMEANAAAACTLLKSMANESRLMILCQLATGEKSVGDLLENVPLSQSAMSQHLALLRRERLVKTRRSAQTIYYSLISEEVMAVMATLYSLYCGQADAKTSKASRKPEFA